MHTPTQPADLPTDWIPSFERAGLDPVFTGMDPARFATSSGIPLKQAQALRDAWVASWPEASAILSHAGLGTRGCARNDAAVADADNARARKPRKGARS
jgi:hypothetical protein